MCDANSPVRDLQGLTTLGTLDGLAPILVLDHECLAALAFDFDGHGVPEPRTWDFTKPMEMARWTVQANCRDRGPHPLVVDPPPGEPSSVARKAVGRTAAS